MSADFEEIDQGYDELMGTLREADGALLTVGVHGEDAERGDDAEVNNAELAAIHEFGAEITGHPYAELIVIPPRSFLRSTAEEQRTAWLWLGARLISRALPDGSIVDALRPLAAQMKGDVKTKLTELREPPLEPSTLAGRRYGGDNPLVDAGQLRDSIDGRLNDE